MTDVDSNSLAYSGTAPPHTEQARLARRFGTWYYAEAFLRGMRAYGWSIGLYAIGQPLLYMLAMGLGLGTLVDQDVDGVSYLRFVAPALLVSTAVMSVTAEMTYPVMEGFRWRRTYFAPAASPVSPAQIALGHALAVTLRFVAQCTVFWLFMLVLGATSGAASALIIAVGVLAAMAFGLPLQAYAAAQEEESWQFAFVQRFVVMPMFLFAGTFFPLATMPIYLQWIGWISPVWHGTELARAFSYGAHLSPQMAALHLGFLVACVAAGLALTVHRYRTRLRR